MLELCYGYVVVERARGVAELIWSLQCASGCPGVQTGFRFNDV